MQRKTQIALGVLILPFIIALFLADRLICVPLFWLDNYNFKHWSDKNNQVFYSLLRCVALGVLFLFYKLILWILL